MHASFVKISLLMDFDSKTDIKSFFIVTEVSSKLRQFGRKSCIFKKKILNNAIQLTKNILFNLKILSIVIYQTIWLPKN